MYIKKSEVFFIKAKGMQINENIRDPQVRLIGADGEQLGIVSSADALDKAENLNLDLVLISPAANPPVCKIMDYKKYCFEQERRMKEAKKNQKIVDVKEIQLSIRIEDNDFKTKLNRAIKFLSGGDKVKVRVRFRGREITHPELGMELTARFFDGCKEVSSIEKPAKLDGRNIIMILAPKAV